MAYVTPSLSDVAEAEAGRDYRRHGGIELKKRRLLCAVASFGVSVRLGNRYVALDRAKFIRLIKDWPVDADCLRWMWWFFRRGWHVRRGESVVIGGSIYQALLAVARNDVAMLRKVMPGMAGFNLRLTRYAYKHRPRVVPR